MQISQKGVASFSDIDTEFEVGPAAAGPLMKASASPAKKGKSVISRFLGLFRRKKEPTEKQTAPQADGRFSKCLSHPVLAALPGMSESGNDAVLLSNSAGETAEDEDETNLILNDALPEESKSKQKPRKLQTSLRVSPTQEELTMLSLVPGENAVEFAISGREGKDFVCARAFLWDWTARVVISDIDGTITKSDFRGQILPRFGKDWSQPGVARLFSSVGALGYQFVYLSSRSLVMASGTREYLHELTQAGCTLPRGPVILSPDKLFASLIREVIRRKPEVCAPTLMIGRISRFRH